MPRFTQKFPDSAPRTQPAPPFCREQASEPCCPPQQQLGSVPSMVHCEDERVSVFGQVWRATGRVTYAGEGGGGEGQNEDGSELHFE